MRVATVMAIILGVSACQPKVNNIDYKAVAAGYPCGADKLQHHVGDNINDNLPKVNRPYRLLTPNQQNAQVVDPQRLNMLHDEDGEILQVYCG